jgi:aldehyde dehydrogenase (NAD+)
MSPSSSTFSYSASNLPTQLFINNEYVASANSATLTVHNPVDNSVVSSTVPLANAADVDAAVAAAEAAFPAWRAIPALTRQSIITKFADLLLEHAPALAELTRLTLGAPTSTFGAFETALAAQTWRYNAGWVDKLAGESFPQEDGFLKIVRHEPLGVVAGIVPWNGPMGTAALKGAPALATGNCFILKPSEKTPFAALALGPLITAAGFPPGVFQVLSGDGSTGALLAQHMRVRKVSFTGSIATGKKIAAAAANSNLKRVTLELGGKSPAVVFDDADIDNAVKWCADAITNNTGQVCFAASRVYVQEGIAERFIAAYQKAMTAKAATAGDPTDLRTLMGPLVDKAQFERVMGFIERGRADKGAGQCIAGGARIGEDGFFVQPTLFRDVPHTSELLQEEIFGPVAVVNTFKTEAEILALANDSEFGLMAGVFTQDINKALRVASDLDAGMVGVNCVSLMFQNAPFGGSKQSGVGREAGSYALKAFTEPKTIMVNLTY